MAEITERACQRVPDLVKLLHNMDNGGLEFSAYAHSQVVTKLSTRSSALSVSVMVPILLRLSQCL